MLSKSPRHPADAQQSNHRSRMLNRTCAFDAHFESIPKDRFQQLFDSIDPNPTFAPDVSVRRSPRNSRNALGDTIASHFAAGVIWQRLSAGFSSRSPVGGTRSSR